MATQEASHAKTETALLSGWFAERFAREERLQGPQHYIAEMLNGEGVDAETQQAMAEVELHRMALMWDLDVEDIADDE